MNLLVSTVPRSGSTLLFNMSRLLFEQIYGKHETYATWVQFFQENKQKKHNIVKIHDRSEKFLKWSNKVITCIRDLRYIIASYADFVPNFNINDPNNLRNICSTFVRIMDMNTSVAHYVFKYEDYFANKVQTVIDVANTLELPIKKINVSQVLKELDEIKNKKYEKLDRGVTQMHPNHISPKSDADITHRISREQICFIENNFSSFFKKHNYKTSCLIKMM